MFHSVGEFFVDLLACLSAFSVTLLEMRFVIARKVADTAVVVTEGFEKVVIVSLDAGLLIVILKVELASVSTFGSKRCFCAILLDVGDAVGG